MGCLGVAGLGYRWREGRVEYVTAPLQRDDLVVSITATGTLRAVGAVEVGAEVSGKLSSVDADYNDPVSAGQVLARIDPEQLEAQVDQADAQVRVARATVEQAKAS